MNRSGSSTHDTNTSLVATRPGIAPVDDGTGLPALRCRVSAMDSSLSAAIRAELRAFVAAAGTRRSLPTTCHIGHPGGQHSRWVHGGDTDEPTMRVDLVERAIDGLVMTNRACGWLTRAGELDLADADAEWFAAARAGFARHGLPLPNFFVLNRSGWVNLVTGERRVWTRVRTVTAPPEDRGCPG